MKIKIKKSYLIKYLIKKIIFYTNLEGGYDFSIKNRYILIYLKYIQVLFIFKKVLYGSFYLKFYDSFEFLVINL